MRVDPFKSFNRILPLSPLLPADSDNGGSAVEKDQVHEKIAESKHRRIPVGKFIFLLAVVVLTLIVLEYFI